MAENYREPEIIFEGWMAPEGTGIIVTGAASGIGAATCILAAQGGLKVAAWDMFAEGIQETIERAGKFGENIKAIQADLGSDDAVDRAMTVSYTHLVTYFKATHGKRLFKMSPIHHHFELCGWSETRIVAVFSIITALLCLVALMGI